MEDKINNKLKYYVQLGNFVRDHMPKVAKNPADFLRYTEKNKQMAVIGKT